MAEDDYSEVADFLTAALRGSLERAASILNGEEHQISLVGSDDKTYVFPLTMIENIIDGKISLTQVKGWEPIIRAVLNDWLEDKLDKIKEQDDEAREL